MSFGLSGTALILLYLVSFLHALTNVEEIICLDNNITHLMDNALTKEEESRMERFISFYTGEMAGVVWQMIEPYQAKDLWHVSKEIYIHGKPRFIDFKFNTERFVRLFQWTLDDITFFTDLRTDSNTVWEQFVETYREKRSKYHHTIDDTTIPSIVEIKL
ncbi:hypothetical protein J6590_016271 [Homalodisca vitripennis]|nr:hypothetical protein J6590_016271 [Homalodisca vitripennis]